MDATLDKCSREATDFDEFRKYLDGVCAEDMSVEKEEACFALCGTIYDCTVNETNECQEALIDCQRGCVQV
ncbi:hypothetical protein BGZ81_000399 [Podila clonocystis]|nr:hypothetical protein BGZ81_000399 [Podila clonocystis]